MAIPPAHDTRHLTVMAGRESGNVEGPSFFKFFGSESRELLRIPPSFSQYLQNQRTGLVLLRGVSAKKWYVELASDTEGYFFRRGWKDFIIDHSIEEGNLLTFFYDGHSQFSVMIFNRTGVQKPSSFHAKPSKGFMVESDEDDEGVAPQEENNGATRRTIEIDSEESDEDDNGVDPQEENNETTKKNIRKRTKAVKKYQKHLAVISQRSPVSEEQRSCALQRAEKYKSKYPSTLLVMKETYVYRKFYMKIPCDFCRNYLPSKSKKLTLWDPQGTSWEVEYIYCNKRYLGAFKGGWKEFSVGNNLEMFDVCVFELFAEDNIKVHVFRANLLITPYRHQEDLSAEIPN